MTTKSEDVCDLLIGNATVIDGTGADRFEADIAIIDDRIAAIGDLREWSCRSRVDAARKVATPGFIDSHTHDDRALLSGPDMTPKISQGVTTVVAGNCGISLAPLAGTDPPPPLNLLGGRDWYRFESTSDYLHALAAEPPALNAALLIGHSTLRTGVMDNLDRPADDSEIARMGELIDAAMEAGYIGLSLGLDYPPARAAPTEEVIALARHLPRHKGICTVHMRDETDGVVEAIEETLEIGRSADVPLVISHFKVAGRDNWGRSQQTLALVAAAQQHQSVDFDVYPYVASSTVLLPQFATEAERVLIAWSEAHPELAGKELSHIESDWGCSREEAIERLHPAGAIYYSMDEKDLRRILSHPGAMVGSDGLPHDVFPHPRLWGTFPRVLGHYARDIGLFSLENAVHRMTGSTAAVFGLEGRGVLREGGYADIVLLDPDTILDAADFEHPLQPALGIELVIVNGQTVWEGGAHTGARPGRVLRRLM